MLEMPFRQFAVAFPVLFSDGTETGLETEASPKIFSDREGFENEASKLKAAAIRLSRSQSLDDLRGAFQELSATCESCHSVYRIHDHSTHSH